MVKKAFGMFVELVRSTVPLPMRFMIYVKRGVRWSSAVLHHTCLYTCQQTKKNDNNKKKLRRKRKAPSKRFRCVINVHIKVHIYSERDQNFTLRVLKKETKIPTATSNTSPPFQDEKARLFSPFLKLPEEIFTSRYIQTIE